MKSSKGKIFNFLRENHRITLTANGSDGKPDAVTRKFTIDDDEIFLKVSDRNVKKQKEIFKNQTISCVVTANKKTLQFKANIERLKGKEAERAKKAIKKSKGILSKYQNPRSNYYVIRPTWMKLQDFNARPIQELYYEVDD